jgi:UDP-3-O-[3-hydroxymyristoyl] glucosamine N-acyltransferase
MSAWSPEPFAVGDLAELLRADAGLSGERIADPTRRLSGFSALDEQRPGTLTWTRTPLPADADIVAAAIITSPEQAPFEAPVDILPAPSPRTAFALALRRFGRRPRPQGVEPTAVVGADCRLGERVYIGHHAVVGDRVTVGDETVIMENVSVAPGCSIGRRCTVFPGVVIGADGFGYQRDEVSREIIKLEHLGTVVIEDDVEIGANTCIDRGALGATRIRAGARIDNLCHIAHNVDVGERAFVIALAMIGGSVRLGDDSWTAPAAAVRNRLSVGAGATVGMGAVVVRDVADGETVAGVPAKPLPPST